MHLRGVIPGSAPLELVIARTGSAALAVSGAGVYPTGLSFSLVVRLRSLSAQVRPLHELVMGVRRRGPSHAAELDWTGADRVGAHAILRELLLWVGIHSCLGGRG